MQHHPPIYLIVPSHYHNHHHPYITNTHRNNVTTALTIQARVDNSWLSWCSGDLPLDFHDIHLKYRYFEGAIRRLFHYMNILDMVLLFLPVEDNELPLKMRREINQISH